MRSLTLPHGMNATSAGSGRPAGFTLIELMVALAIVSILAAITYPSYQSYVMKGKRGDAHTLLMEAAVKQEHFYAQHGVYSADMRELGYSADPALSAHGLYQVDADWNNGSAGYLLTATRRGVMTNDTGCGDLTLSHTGLKSALNNTNSDPGKNCW